MSGSIRYQGGQGIGLESFGIRAPFRPDVRETQIIGAGFDRMGALASQQQEQTQIAKFAEEGSKVPLKREADGSLSPLELYEPDTAAGRAYNNAAIAAATSAVLVDADIYAKDLVQRLETEREKLRDGSMGPRKSKNMIADFEKSWTAYAAKTLASMPDALRAQVEPRLLKTGTEYGLGVAKKQDDETVNANLDTMQVDLNRLSSDISSLDAARRTGDADAKAAEWMALFDNMKAVGGGRLDPVKVDAMRETFVRSRTESKLFYEAHDLFKAENAKARDNESRSLAVVREWLDGKEVPPEIKARVMSAVSSRAESAQGARLEGETALVRNLTDEARKLYAGFNVGQNVEQESLRLVRQSLEKRGLPTDIIDSVMSRVQIAAAADQAIVAERQQRDAVIQKPQVVTELQRLQSIRLNQGEEAAAREALRLGQLFAGTPETRDMFFRKAEEFGAQSGQLDPEARLRYNDNVRLFELGILKHDSLETYRRAGKFGFGAVGEQFYRSAIEGADRYQKRHLELMGPIRAAEAVIAEYVDASKEGGGRAHEVDPKRLNDALNAYGKSIEVVPGRREYPADFRLKSNPSRYFEMAKTVRFFSTDMRDQAMEWAYGGMSDPAKDIQFARQFLQLIDPESGVNIHHSFSAADLGILRSLSRGIVDAERLAAAHLSGLSDEAKAAATPKAQEILHREIREAFRAANERKADTPEKLDQVRWTNMQNVMRMYDKNLLTDILPHKGTANEGPVTTSRFITEMVRRSTGVMMGSSVIGEGVHPVNSTRFINTPGGELDHSDIGIKLARPLDTVLELVGDGLRANFDIQGEGLALANFVSRLLRPENVVVPQSAQQVMLEEASAVLSGENINARDAVAEITTRFRKSHGPTQFHETAKNGYATVVRDPIERVAGGVRMAEYLLYNHLNGEEGLLPFYKDRTDVAVAIARRDVWATRVGPMMRDPETGHTYYQYAVRYRDADNNVRHSNRLLNIRTDLGDRVTEAGIQAQRAEADRIRIEMQAGRNPFVRNEDTKNWPAQSFRDPASAPRLYAGENSPSNAEAAIYEAGRLARIRAIREFTMPGAR